MTLTGRVGRSRRRDWQNDRRNVEAPARCISTGLDTDLLLLLVPQNEITVTFDKNCNALKKKKRSLQEGAQSLFDD